MCYIFNGISKKAQELWINNITYNYLSIKNTPHMTDRRRFLECLASQIDGISDKVVEKTLAEIEATHYEL